MDFGHRLSHLAAYRAASPQDRVRMIREAYEDRARGRLNAYIHDYERRHGIGSYAEHRAELERESPPTLSVAGPFGAGDYGHGSIGADRHG